MQEKDKITKIHKASMELLAKTGMKFHHEEAIRLLSSHGIKTDGNIAYFTEEQIMHWVGMAPAEAFLYAEDSRYNMCIGGEQSYVGPCGGATFIREKDGTTREAVFSDFIKLIKLFEGNPEYYLNGGLACQPSDIPTEYAVILLALASMMHTKKCIFAAAGTKGTMEALIKLACIRYGITIEELMEKPRLCTIANTNTPLQLDKTMTETILTMAKYKQPVIIASAAMAGTTSPVTLAGTIAMVNAEVLAAIALAQMASPGTPVIYGSQSTAADMATCAIAIGSPEGALCYKYCGKMAKFYGIPSRAGGALSDAKILNAQAGYEAMLTYLACKENGVSLMTQSAGILDSYLAVSYEKLIVDFEIQAFANRYLKDIEVNEETIPMELMEELKQDAQYLVEDHTLEYCRKELCIPTVSVRGPHSNPGQQLEKNIEKQMQKLLDKYEKPEVSEAIIQKLKEFLQDQGIEHEWIDKALA